MPPVAADPSLLSVAHVIQLALTPVFLLSGIAALLNVFSGRLARVADQVDLLARELDEGKAADSEHSQRQLRSLRRRSHTLDVAVMLGAAGGVATGLSVMTLFVGALNAGGADVLLWSFGVGVVCTIAAMSAYLVEALLAGQGVRREVTRAQRPRSARPRLPHLWWSPPPGGAGRSERRVRVPPPPAGEVSAPADEGASRCADTDPTSLPLRGAHLWLKGGAVEACRLKPPAARPSSPSPPPVRA